MCIAIYKPAGQWVSKEELRNSFENDPHGAGFAYHNGKRVVMKKGFFTFRSFWRAYKAEVTNDTPAFAHFRIATRGAKDASNCHPFAIPGGVLMHNGPCLNHKACAGTETRSDSKQFAEDFIAGLTAHQVLRIKPMIEQFIGSEKVALMFDSGEVILCNEDVGLWEHGCWFSNTGHHAHPVYYGYHGTRSYMDDDYVWESRYQRKTNSTTSIVTQSAPIKERYIYDRNLGLFIPGTVIVEGIDHYWDKDFSAYLPNGTSDQAVADDDFVYDWHGNDKDPSPVGEVIHDEKQLRLFLQLELDTPINLASHELALVQ